MMLCVKCYIFLNAAKKPKTRHIFIDPCPVEHLGDACTSLKAESSLHVSKQSCCAGRKDVPGRLLVSIRLRCKALIQTLWFSGWGDVSCAPVKGSLPPSLKKEKCFVTRGERLAQVLPVFDVDTLTGGNPPTCIHLTYRELSYEITWALPYLLTSRMSIWQVTVETEIVAIWKWDEMLTWGSLQCRWLELSVGEGSWTFFVQGDFFFYPSINEILTISFFPHKF